MADEYSGYEIINIPPLTKEQSERLAKYTIVESPWITHHNGITGEYYQYHRETGERREVPIDWWDCGVQTTGKP